MNRRTCNTFGFLFVCLCMAAEIDFRGGRLTLTIQRGCSAPLTFTEINDTDGDAITNFTAVRMTIRRGTPDDTTAGTVILALSASATANGSTVTTNGSTITIDITPADTRLIPAGANLWWQMEADDSNGDTWSVAWGPMRSRVEGVS